VPDFRVLRARSACAAHSGESADCRGKLLDELPDGVRNAVLPIEDKWEPERPWMDAETLAKYAGLTKATVAFHDFVGAATSQDREGGAHDAQVSVRYFVERGDLSDGCSGDR
jgi:hypothetical protein